MEQQDNLERGAHQDKQDCLENEDQLESLALEDLQDLQVIVNYWQERLVSILTSCQQRFISSKGNFKV